MIELMWWIIFALLLSPVLVAGAVFIGTVSITLWQVFKINFWLAVWIVLILLWLIL